MKKRADARPAEWIKIKRKINSCEFMTIDGVIQNEENDGDGFKYGEKGMHQLSVIRYRVKQEEIK
jgi:hypothetical protein